MKAAKSGRGWLNCYELQRLTAGAAKLLDISSNTIQKVCEQYTRCRMAKSRPWLRWRGRKSLGWVPFSTGNVKFDGEKFRFRSSDYETLHLRNLERGVKIGIGSFNADSKGRWYINVPIEVKPISRIARRENIGIDLGLVDIVVLSDGAKIKAPQFYRKLEGALAVARRGKKRNRVRSLCGKVANQRKDFLHKLSNQITKEYGLIVIGDVSPSKLAKTRMAKSIYDAGWSDLKRMLSYKSIRNGGSCLEVSEHNTSQTCSACGALPPERPRGIAGLGIREWTCSGCGTVHDRDANAARNILRLGLEALAEGAPLLGSGQCYKTEN